MKEFLIITLVSVIMFVAGYFTHSMVSWLRDTDDEIEDEPTEY